MAVIDTGVHPVYPCLASGQVLTPGFDVWGENAATAPDIAGHGTWVGGVIASKCGYAGPPTSPLIKAVQTHAPGLLYPYGGGLAFDILGIAPEAKIYPVKAFRKNGGTTWAKVLEAMDHVVDVKATGSVDVDVVNLSLGKLSFFDGHEISDLLVDEMRKAGIVVVSAAANSGPLPSTIATPGTSPSSITAGATEEAVSSRIFYEWYGLFLGADGVPGTGDETTGWGYVMRPTTEARIVSFSSRGPTGDGRGKPDISALGTWNFVQGVSGSLDWVGGTSFATPTVAGGAALLNAYWEGELGFTTHPGKIRNALLRGASAKRVGVPWRDFNTQGHGTLWMPAALAALKDWKCLPGAFTDVRTGRLAPNVLCPPWPGRTERTAWRSHVFRPGELKNLVFEIGEATSRVTIEGKDLRVPPNTTPVAFYNALELHVQSAKRSAVSSPVNLWIGHDQVAALGGAFKIEIEDGDWLLNGLPVEWEPGVPVSQPMEPGLMKLSLGGDWVNQFPVGLKVRITRENDAPHAPRPLYRNWINNGDLLEVPVAIPAGTARATFDLRWARDWSRFPTSDIDLILVDPDGTMVFDGATVNAPERTVVANPKAGNWLAYLAGYQVDRTDYVRLYLKLE